jgi:hypothetical protein
MPVHTKKWSDLEWEARAVWTVNIPDALRERPLLLLVMIIAFPHRGIPEAVRFLDWKLGGPWFVGPPIEKSPH